MFVARRAALVTAILLVVTLFAAPGTAGAQPTSDSSDLINEALDHPVNLELNTALPQALDAIAQTTGVRVEADRAVWELLPWGDQTQVSARLEKVTLRDGIDGLARKLGLVAVVRPNVVELQPIPALRRLGRRATLEEIAGLELLATTPFDAPAEQQHTVRTVVDAVDDRLARTNAAYAVEFRPAESLRPGTPVNVPRNASLLDALESVHRDTSGTWHPWGKSILVVPKTDQVRMLLEKPITARYSNVNVGQVLLELSQASGVELQYEPGALQRVPPRAASISLLLDDATVRQALEQIAASTGLGYVPTDRGVYVWNETAGQGPVDPLVGSIPLDGGMNLLLSRSDLPDDVRAYLEQKATQQIARLREQMRAEGFVDATSTTAPSSAPTMTTSDGSAAATQPTTAAQ